MAVYDLNIPPVSQKPRVSDDVQDKVLTFDWWFLTNPKGRIVAYLATEKNKYRLKRPVPMLWKILILNTKIITTVDDYIRLVAMTAISLLITFWLDLSGIPFVLVVGIGIAIDVHDLAVKFIEEKPIL